MAVRAFDISEPTTHLTLVEPAPLRRQEIRVLRQRAVLLAVAALTVPFVVAVVIVGVGL